MGRKGNKSPKRKHSDGLVDGNVEIKRNKSPNENNHNNSNNSKTPNSKTHNNKRKNGKNNPHYKKSNKSKLVWVDRCTTNNPPTHPNKFSGIIHVKVTGADLSDDHTHGGLKNRVETSFDDDENIVTTTTYATTTSITKANDMDKSEVTQTTQDVKVQSSEKNENDDVKKETEKNINEDVCKNVEAVEVNESSSDDNDDDNDKKANESKDVLSDMMTSPSSEPKQQKIDEESPKQQNKRPKEPFVQVLRCKSASMKKNFKRKETCIDLPNGDCGDGILNPFPKDEVDDKYWAQRKRFFSKFDDGIQLDKESWYSVTPEAIAIHVAQRMVEDIKLSSKMMISSEKNSHDNESGSGAIVVDAFCGCGGNAIGLARMKSSDIQLVLCIDIDRSKLKMAANNASIYGVEPNRMLFIEGDSTMILQNYFKDGNLVTVVDSNNNEKQPIETETFKGFRIGGPDLLPPRLDAVFMSPPWGGMNYMNTGKRGYLIQSISIQSSNNVTIDGVDLLRLARNACRLKFVTYFLPRNINGHDLGKSAWKIGYRDIEIEKNVLNGKLKTVTVYLRN